MSDLEKAIDYKGFKGAGAPNAPPPQKPNTNPTRVRLLLLLLSPVLIATVTIVFFRTFNTAGTFIPHIIAALCTGITYAIYDWILEAYAYKKGLWFCYGGIHKIGRIDFKHVPIDMVIGFIGNGYIVAFITYYPELLRNWGWNFWPLSDSNMDIWLVPGLLVIIALFGAFGDFQSKRMGNWMNGPTWSYWKCAFFAWLPGLTSGVIVDRLIMITWTNLTLLILTIVAVFLIQIIILIIFIKKIIK